MDKIRDILEFYANPRAWKLKHDPENDIGVPDFYSELSFGDMAEEALGYLETLLANRASTDVTERAREMRHAIDMFEGAMMGLGDFVDLPELFEAASDDLKINPSMTVGQMRRVCEALAECTRIINSDEYVIRNAPCSSR